MAKGLIRVKITGFRGIGKAIESLEKKAGKKVIRKGVTKGSQVYTKALKERAPKQTGLLKKSLGQRIKSYKGGRTVVGLSGPRSGFKKEVEVKIRNKKGTRIIARKKEVRDPRKYAHITEAKRPWMKPTFVARQREVEQAAMDAMRAELAIALREVSQGRTAA
jgi:hypothetical protein